MHIDIVTVFPELIEAALNHSIVKRARERGLINIKVINLRDFTTDRHRTTDDAPYGGGGGMVMKVEPIARAIESLNIEACNSETVALSDSSESTLRTNPETTQPIKEEAVGSLRRPRIVLTDPRGPKFDQETARLWALDEHIILLCGHYEGVDERVRRHFITNEISIGDYVLTGGELPALVITDALTRLQRGSLGDEDAPDKDTFSDNLLEYPHYTRPRDFQGHLVPDILFGGHHVKIERWRRRKSLLATREHRPDLFAKLILSVEDLKLLNSAESDFEGETEPSK